MTIGIMMFFVCVAQPDSTLITDSIANLKRPPESLVKLLEEVKSAETKVVEDADLEIDGLLIDETKTKSGRDFFDIFYMNWQAPQNARNYSIFVRENPYRLMTTQIEVKLNETTVFRSFLQPRADIIEQQAEYAVSQTLLYLANYEELMRQLEGEDRAGTGIF
jgi:curli production assembly/transport component CsgE